MKQGKNATDRLVFGGDAFLPRAFASSIEGAHGLVFNLEHPITKRTIPATGKVVLKAGREHIRATFGTSPLAVCLANNHVMDYGPDGLLDTIRALDAAGVRHFGAGTASDDCGNPLLVEAGGVTVALSGYVCPTTHPIFAGNGEPGVARIDAAAIAGDADRARKAGADRVVVCLHWGEEEVFLPAPADVELATKLADAGVDLVIGHHSHVIQPWTKLGSTPVYFGLGNLVFPDMDLESDFDETGGPAGRYRKKQAPWNRLSLLVDYHPRSGIASPRLAYFDGEAIGPAGGHVPSLGLAGTPGEGMAARYRLSYLEGNLRARAWSFLCRPRVPTLNQVFNLFRL